MFRKYNVYNENQENKYVLMKNIKEPSAIIPNQYIEERYDGFREVSKLSIQIPYYITNKTGKKVVNEIAKKFLGKGQRINVQNNGEWIETFYVTKRKNIDNYYGTNSELKGQRIIEIEALSYDDTLNNVDCVFSENTTIQLYRNENETTDVTDGVLNIFEQENPLWRVGYVSEKARKEINNVNVMQELKLDSNKEIPQMDRPTIIFESDVDIEPNSSDDLIDLSIFYSNVDIYSNLNGELELEGFKISHENIFKAYSKIKKIKVTYCSTEEYRYAFKYEFTMADGNVISKIKEVGCYSDLRMIIGSIIVRYTNGLNETKESVKYRSFDEGSEKWLTFLRENVESAYDVVFDFDSYNRVVNCYATEEVGEHTGIRLTFQNYIEEAESELQYDEIVTKLWVTSENCKISDVNPIGTDYIYDFTYFVNNGLLTDECCKAWKRYEEIINESQIDLAEKREIRNTLTKRRIRYETELAEKEIAYSDISNILAVYIKESNNNKITEYGEKKATLEQDINNIISSIALVKDEIANLDNEIDNYLKKVTLETAYDEEGKIFNEELLTELHFNMIEKELKDENFITAQSLYDYAKEQLKERNSLKIQQSITINGLKEKMVIPKGKTWDGIVKVGNFFSMVEQEEDLRIVSITTVPKNQNKLKEIGLSNTLERKDNFTKLEDISTIISKASYTMETMKDVWNTSKDANEFYYKMKNGYLDNVATSIKGRNQNCILDMSSGSIFIIDADNKDSQIYLGAGLIAITSDGWITSDLAIDKGGINANLLVGKIILGEKLHIVSDRGDFYIGEMNNNDGFGIKITDNNEVERIFLGTEIINGERKARLRLYNKNGKGLCLSEEGIIVPYQFTDRDHVDCYNQFVSYFWSDANVIDYKNIFMRIVFRPYRVYSKSLSSGGVVNQQVGTTITGGSGTTTSASGGGSTYTSEYGGGYNKNISATSAAGTVSVVSGECRTGVMSWGDGVLKQDTFSHSHTIDWNHFNKHTHNVSISLDIPSHAHSVVIPNHTHDIEIPQHSHTLNLSFSTEHTHDINYGIIDLTGHENYPSNVSLTINGTWVKDNVQSGEIIDIKNYIQKGITTPNTIKLSSSSRGIFIVSYFVRPYTSWEMD